MSDDNLPCIYKVHLIVITKFIVLVVVEIGMVKQKPYQNC